MKKNIRMFLAATLLLMCGNVLADSSMPGGTYYFDFTDCTGDNAVRYVEIFNGMGSHVSIVSSATCAVNTGVTKVVGSDKQFSNSGNDFTYLCVTLDGNQSTNQTVFIQYQTPGGSWKNWANYSTPSPVSGESNVYLCKVSYSEGNCTYSWHTGTLPSNICSSTPSLTIAAGANGTLGACTAGGTAISGTTEIEAGTSVHLIADPNDDYSFYGWVRADGSVASTLADYVFSMPSSSLSLTATFYSDNTDPSISGCDGCFRIEP